MDLIGPSFDPIYYLKNIRDVADAGEGPAEHFCRAGWREGSDPNPEFSTQEYLRSNTDVLGSNVNPFLHFILTKNQSDERDG
ncbi:hypothetical protein KZZ10_10240 [Alcaligenaceae bacterium LF4-65]|uniref:Uncharacterized protein n=1 Tax=Zwartia hollandica TaxID=324606 RepID=A0A953NA15_9BURK|nr:hypothetical protein [Zwartia hollandica]MBZ1351024.1 hypothetical protein [Zwartia hollandica]